jgi:hypothetical protein
MMRKRRRTLRLGHKLDDSKSPELTMDLAAELTLQIADFLQSDSEIPRSPRQWLLVPGRGGSPASFPTAVDRLSANRLTSRITRSFSFSKMAGAGHRETR